MSILQDSIYLQCMHYVTGLTSLYSLDTNVDQSLKSCRGVSHVIRHSYVLKEQSNVTNADSPGRL